MTDLRRMSAFRDVQAALDFQQMASLGYIDTEFTMYGCAYWAQGQRQYVISSKEADIWRFIEEGKKEARYTTPIASLTKVCPVTMGQKEAMANKVKLDLAQQLQADYPAAFWAEFVPWTAVAATDTARPIVEAICQEAAAAFSQEQLTLAEEAVVLAFDSKVLSKASYQQLMALLAHERDKLLEDVTAKDILEKHFYTLLYEAAPGRLKRLTNARREWIQQKKSQLEKEGKLTAPILAKTYWYNNQQTLDDVKSWHEAACDRILTEDYFAQIRAIAACQGPYQAAAYWAAGKEVRQKYGGKAWQMWTICARRWHISNEGEIDL